VSSPSPDAKRRQFDKQLKAIVRPELAARGFLFDGKRVFRRAREFDGWTAIQIVEFQLGRKSLVGRFTANVGVFAERFRPLDWHAVGGAPGTCDCLPAMWKRLGYFFDQPRSWVASMLGHSKPERGDYWWEQHSEEQKMAQSLQSALACLSGEALPWLNLLSCEDALKWAVSELARAKRWKAAQGTPGAEPDFVLRYYDDIAQPCASPNGGPATPPPITSAPGGPPSVN
jgi:hypothetical protein